MQGEICDIDGTCVDAADDEIFKLTTKGGSLSMEREKVISHGCVAIPLQHTPAHDSLFTCFETGLASHAVLQSALHVFAWFSIYTQDAVVVPDDMLIYHLYYL